MPRFLSTLLVIALLGGTAAAFAVTQGLKIEPSPIRAPRIAKVISPECDCPTRVAAIQFRLRKPDRVRLEIVDDDGKVVRTLVPGLRLRRGTVSYTWNGRDDAGKFVPEGVYKPRVHLTGQHRTIDLPNEMRVDTTAPKVTAGPPVPKTILAGPARDGEVHAVGAGARDPVRRRDSRSSSRGASFPPACSSGTESSTAKRCGPAATRCGSLPRIRRATSLSR